MQAQAVPFEAVVGTPALRYGPRLTFRPLGAATFSGVEDFLQHPWGAPDWIGVRVTADGRPQLKGYYARARELTDVSPPRGAPSDLHPVMASRDGCSEEVYWRWRGEGRWSVFAARCAALVDAAAPVCAPLPRPTQDGFCVSVRREQGRVTAVSLFADGRCLPDDRVTAREWAADMPDDERRAYELSLAAVRSFGPAPLRGWHGMLGWTLERDARSHRAVSLNMPALTTIV